MNDGIYFDPALGWVAIADVHESDTTKCLKEILAELKSGASTDCLYDAVERLLFKYRDFVKQGIREKIADHNGVSWYLTAKCGDQHALISYQDGPSDDWCNDCYADEVPLWLLIGLFRRVQRRKPLGDQDADETIASVDDLDAEYAPPKRQPSKLNVMPHRQGDV